MAVFDGLINWWAFGDMADTLTDGGSFAGSSSFPFRDHIAAYGLPAHDGAYGQGSVTYAPGETINGYAESWTGAPWQCAADAHGIHQTIPGPLLNPVIDPQVGHFASNLGIVPIPSGPGLWFEPRDGWTIAIWCGNFGGYAIQRVPSGMVTRQHLFGSHLTTGFSDRGWDIVCDLGTMPYSPPGVTMDGLADLVDTQYDGTGAYKFVMTDLGVGFSLTFGRSSSDYELLVLTYDSVNLRTYNLAVNPLGPVTTRPTTTGELHFGGQAYHWGSRYNLGSDDNGYTRPWNGIWDETLQWNRALSFDEIKQLPHACDSQVKIKSRFFARNAESNNNFSRPQRIRGASGQTVPRDPAGHTTETFEPKGANLKRGLHQTMWYKWVAPSSGNFIFHTGDGHPADVYSSAPLELTALDASQPPAVAHPGASDNAPPVVGGSYSSPPPGGSVFPSYPRQIGKSLYMFVATGDDWIERNPDVRIPGAGRTIIDWASGVWTPVQYQYTERLWRAPSFGSDQTFYTYGRNPAYVTSVPSELPGYRGPDHTDHTGPAETFAHWFSDVLPPAGHVWDTGWIDPTALDAYPHITSDAGLSFDTLEAGLWQLEFDLIIPSSNPQGQEVEDQNNPNANIIGVNFPGWKSKLFKARLRETVTDTVIAYHERPGWEMQLNSGSFNVSGGMPIGTSTKDFSYIPLLVGKVPSGRNFVVEIWQNTGSTLHTSIDGTVWLAKLADEAYPYPVLP